MSLLIFAWVSSLAFYQYPVLGTLSIDNIGAPLMFLLALSAPQREPTEYGKAAVLLALVVYAPYFASHLVSRGTSPGTFVPTLYELSKAALYFITPVALCTSNNRRRYLFLGLVFVAAAVNLSNLAATLGFYVPPSERLTSSRLGIEWLPRSVGLFVNYGDQAMISAIAVLIAVGWFRHGKLRTLSFVSVLLVVFLGLAASQSRNIALTILGGILAFMIFNGAASNSRMVRRTAITFAVAMAIACTCVGIFYFADLVAELTNWGGVQASSTAADRLVQYKFALNALEGNWLFGVDEEFYQRNQVNIEYIHNLWLRELLRSGVPGALSMLAVILFIAVSAMKRPVRGPDEVRPYAIAFAVCAASGIATQFYIGSGYILWFLLGVCFALIQRPKSRAKSATKRNFIKQENELGMPALLSETRAINRTSR